MTAVKSFLRVVLTLAVLAAAGVAWLAYQGSQRDDHGVTVHVRWQGVTLDGVKWAVGPPMVPHVPSLDLTKTSGDWSESTGARDGQIVTVSILMLRWKPVSSVAWYECEIKKDGQRAPGSRTYVRKQTSDTLVCIYDGT